MGRLFVRSAARVPPSRAGRYAFFSFLLAAALGASPWMLDLAQPAWPFVAMATSFVALSWLAHRRWKTEHEWFQDALHRYDDDQRQLQRHVDEMPIALYRAEGPHRRGVQWLNRGTALLGYGGKDGDPERADFDDVVDPDDLSRVRQDVARAVQGGRLFRMRYNVKRYDGSSVHVEDWGMVTHGDGERAVVVGCMIDATEVRRLEQRLAHNDRLELVGRMAGEVAHDVSNLLSPALMVAEVLSETETGQLADDLRMMIGALVSSRDLLTQLLHLSRPATGGPKTLRLEKLVGNNQELLSRLAGRDTPMRFELEAPEGLIRAVPGEVQQLLLNLIANAGEAVSDGGDILVQTRMVTLTPDDNEAGLPPGHYVRLVVHDTGRGMDERTRERLFEPYFTTKGDRGSGLGMAIVYAVVRRHDGTILVDSEPGKGTRIAVYFPSAAVDEASGVA